ncbi:MAG: Hpt domain-containing protein [Candidatus Cloacimonetes bacterium]|nr:Hpt domain-containing protein [Candidatus Cloacimonadota bacterium]
MQDAIFNQKEAIDRIYDLDLINQLLAQFNETLTAEVASLLNALENDDMHTAEQISHSLKGVAGNLSLIGIYQAATALNDAIKLSGSNTMDNFTNKLLEEIDRFNAWLPGYLSAFEQDIS